MSQELSSKLRRHKLMERAIRSLMGAGVPPRFKFKDTYSSVEFPTGYTVPAQATLEAKFAELEAEEEDLAPKTKIQGDFEIGTANVFVDVSSGRVGIGTNTPSRPLSIESNSFGGVSVKRTGAGAGSAMEFINGNDDKWTLGTGGTGTFGIYNGSTFGQQFTIDTSGNVGIGKSNPTRKLDVVGDIYATGNITGYSDKRAKSDIQKIENALEKLEQINGYTFTMNDKRYTGVIAQEVLPVLPEAVTGSEETHYAVAYGNMMGLIIEAIKELKKKVEQ